MSSTVSECSAYGMSFSIEYLSGTATFVTTGPASEKEAVANATVKAHANRIDLLHRMIGNDMNSLARVLFGAAVSAIVMWGDGPGWIDSKQIGRDFALTADPTSFAWRG